MLLNKFPHLVVYALNVFGFGIATSACGECVQVFLPLRRELFTARMVPKVYTGSPHLSNISIPKNVFKTRVLHSIYI